METRLSGRKPNVWTISNITQIVFNQQTMSRAFKKKKTKKPWQARPQETLGPSVPW